MAITVAYVASMATSLGWFDLDFWWELGALISIMLLGHWQEMKALGQAQDALAALAALLPDEAERLDRRRDLRDGAGHPSCGRRHGARALRRPRAGRRRDRRRRRRARRVDDHRRVPTGRQGPSATRWWPARCRPTRPSGCGSPRSATTPRSPASADWWPRPRSRGPAARCSPTGPPRCCSTSPPAPRSSPPSCGWLGDTDEAVVRVVTVLVISCPHALGLAIPLTTSLSSALGARNGILIKDRLALEASRTIDAVLFDKTGTLTKGEHAVVGVAAGRGDRRDRGPASRRRRRVRQRAPTGPGHRGSAARDRATVATGDRLPVAHRPRRRGDGRRRRPRRRRTGAAARAVPDGARRARRSGRRVGSERGAAGAPRRPRRPDRRLLALEDEIRPEAREAVDELRARACGS
jgi:P-type Cu2+ transporter